MTISTDPWKLFRIAFALAALTLMIIRPHAGGQPYYGNGGHNAGCSIMHQE